MVRHDNAHSHVAERVKSASRRTMCEVSKHDPYNRSLKISDDDP